VTDPAQPVLREQRRDLDGIGVVLDGPASRTTVTTAEGAFSFHGLSPGRYRVRAAGDVVRGLTATREDEFTLPNGYACHHTYIALAHARRSRAASSIHTGSRSPEPGWHCGAPTPRVARS